MSNLGSQLSSCVSFLSTFYSEITAFPWDCWATLSHTHCCKLNRLNQLEQGFKPETSMRDLDSVKYGRRVTQVPEKELQS